MTRRPGAQRKRKCLLRAVRLFRVARVARVVCRRRMTRRLGAQRKGKCRLRVAGLLRSATVTRFLFSFCWPEKQDLITPHDQTSWRAAEGEVRFPATTRHCHFCWAYVSDHSFDSKFLILDVIIQMRRSATAKHPTQSKPYITCGTQDIYISV